MGDQDWAVDALRLKNSTKRMYDVRCTMYDVRFTMYDFYICHLLSAICYLLSDISTFVKIIQIRAE